MQPHRWSFSTIGGVKRVNLNSAEDLLQLDKLDPKLWTALSCPVQGLEIEAKTLALIDADNDGQIRVPEVLAAVRWVLSILSNPEDLLKQEDRLALDAIDPEKENGARLLASARIIRNNLGPDPENKLGVSETSDTASQAEQAAMQPLPPPPTPFDIGKFVGIFAAISLALGAIGTAIASLLGGFMGLVWWKMPIAVGGILLLISGPSMLLAWLKLRKRNLAPLLDANGRAINAKASVNIAFGRVLTQLAALPVGAQINFKDPFVKKRRPYTSWLLLIGLIAGAVLFALWKGWVHFR